MNSIQKTLAAVAVAAFGIGLAPSAGARSTIAWAGASNPLADAACFTENQGRVINSGCGSAVWEIALPVDSEGPWSVTVNVTPGTGSISCEVLFANENGGGGSPGGRVSASGAGAQTITLPNVTLSPGGALFTACFPTKGAAINTVNWSVATS